MVHHRFIVLCVLITTVCACSDGDADRSVETHWVDEDIMRLHHSEVPFAVGTTETFHLSASSPGPTTSSLLALDRAWSEDPSIATVERATPGDLYPENSALIVTFKSSGSTTIHAVDASGAEFRIPVQAARPTRSSFEVDACLAPHNRILLGSSIPANLKLYGQDGVRLNASDVMPFITVDPATAIDEHLRTQVSGPIRLSSNIDDGTLALQSVPISDIDELSLAIDESDLDVSMHEPVSFSVEPTSGGLPVCSPQPLSSLVIDHIEGFTPEVCSTGDADRDVERLHVTAKKSGTCTFDYTVPAANAGAGLVVRKSIELDVLDLP